MTASTTGCAPRIGRVRNAAGLDLWLYEQVDADYGVDAGQLVRDLAAAGPVSVRISSPGGDAFAGLALYEALRSHAGRVTVYIDGVAGSIASVIAPSGMIFVHDALR